jgi:hypothetical protein
LRYFHFRVVGENGTISSDRTEESDSSTIYVRGSKKGQQIELTAIPDDGYQVKEWKYNGEVVEDNKSNSFTAIAKSYKQDKNIITVEFEPIPSEN